MFGKDFIKENKFLIVLFILSTSFFILQHYHSTSWDFMVYVLNAEYWKGESSYFELMRAPMISFTIMIFSPLGWVIAEYLFIIFVSTSTLPT